MVAMVRMRILHGQAGVTRFVEAFSDNTVTLSDSAIYSDGGSWSVWARACWSSANGEFIDLVENSTVLRGVKSGVIGPLRATAVKLAS